MTECKISKELIEYTAAYNWMCSRVDEIISGKAEELIWFLEHDHVYTGGTSSDKDEVLNSELRVIYSGRGGKLTYHGPGQLVVYVMLDLKKRNAKDVKRYIHNVEQVLIDTLQDIGVQPFRLNDKPGVWVNHDGVYKKIAAIGVRIKKWVTFHGFCLNINTDLSYYKHIIPCGLEGYGVSSLFELSNFIDKRVLIQKLQKQMNNTFF